MIITIAGAAVGFAALNGNDQIDQISTARFTVFGSLSQAFTKGQPVKIVDDQNANFVVYRGVLDNATLVIPYYANNTAVWTVSTTDGHYFAAKRVIAKGYQNMAAGAIVQDIVDTILVNEGIVCTRTAPTFTRGSVATQLNGTQAGSGTIRYETSGALPSGTTGSSALIEETTTNLLSANQASVETDTTGFSAVSSATLTRDTTQKWTGAASLKIVTTSTSGSGAQTTAIAGTAGAKYTASAWLFAAASTSVKLSIKDATNTITATATATLAAGTWTRLSATLTYGVSSGSGLSLIVSNNAAAAITVYVDGLQIEALAYATSWIGGGVTRSADQLAIPTASVLNASEGALEIGAYIGATQRGGVTDQYIFAHMDGGGHNRIEIHHATGSANWIFSFGNGSNSYFLSVADSNTPDGWHTFALRWSASELSAWIDGVKLATQAAPVYFPTLQASATIGSHGNTNALDSYIHFARFTYFARSDASLLSGALNGISYDDDTVYFLGFANTLTPTTSITDGPLIVNAPLSYVYCSDAINAIAKAANFYWVIDAHMVLRFGPYTARPAPWVLQAGAAYGGASNALDGTIQVNNGNPLFRNTEYAVGGTDTTSIQTEHFVGDGTRSTFTVGFPLAMVPTITLNGGAQTVGIKGVDTGKQWYWNSGSADIVQDSSGTKLINTDNLQTVYVGTFASVVYATDPHSITQLAAIEQQGTGIVEYVTQTPQSTTRAQGFQLINANLARYDVQAKTLTFQTLIPGLRAGQVLTANIAEYGISNEMFLIDQVTFATPNDAQVTYTVKCVDGPAIGSWIEYFRVLSLSNMTINAVNVGTAQTVIIDVPFTETWTDTETVTPHVYACPIPSATLFPSSTLYPC